MPPINEIKGRANEECNLDPTVHHLKKEDLTPAQVRKLRYQGFCRKTCDLCDDIIFEKETKKEEIKLGKFSPPRPTPSRPRVKNFYRQVMGRSNSQLLPVEYLKCMKWVDFLTIFYFYQFFLECKNDSLAFRSSMWPNSNSRLQVS